MRAPRCFGSAIVVSASAETLNGMSQMTSLFW